MTRVVVAAPYPNSPGPEAAATLSLVRRLVAAGDHVTVISPTPSAAHHHADPGSPRGALRLVRLAAGADVVHLRLDAGALAIAVDSPLLLPARLGINAVVRRTPRTEVRLDRVPTSVGRRWASLVLGPATQVVVSTEDERRSLVAAGVEASKIRVEPEPEVEAPAAAASPPRDNIRLHTPVSASEIQDLVRRRAAADRASRRTAAIVEEGAASLPLRHLVRMERAPIRSNLPGGKFVKRSIAKALHWQFDNVIASVNRLHAATIEAVEALESRQSAMPPVLAAPSVAPVRSDQPDTEHTAS